MRKRLQQTDEGKPFPRRGPPVAILAALLATSAALAAAVASRGVARRWNVLLVTFDTTRADRLGCYGNGRVRTPTLDRLAAEGIRFAHAAAAVPITAPSHSTILTGRYPIAHGVRDNGLFVLGAEQTTLAEVLRENGYATAAAVGAFPLTARFGFGQGFDLFDDHLTGGYEDHLGKRAAPKERLFFDERRAAQVNEAVLPWLARQRSRPFFLWVHYFDPHQPFEPPPPYDHLYADESDLGEVAYADSRLGFLIDRLKAMRVLDRTLIVMTADHGEGLGEHEELTHAVLAYDSTLHVPLIVRPPAGAKGVVVDERVATVDVAATILDLLGVAAPTSVQGRSLVPLWTRGSRPPEPLYAENLSPRLSHGWGELRVLYDRPFKYIHGPRPELFDVEADPRELVNLAARRPADAARMRDRLARFMASHATGATRVGAVDPDVRERLAALGYLSGGGSGQVITEELREDGLAPQDRVRDVNDISAAKHLLFQGRAADAMAYTSRLVERDPRSPLYLELHASALIETGQFGEAAEALEGMRTAGRLPDTLPLRLAALRFEAGDRRGAVDDLARLVESSPRASSAWVLATLRTRMGDQAGARDALRRALHLDARYAPARTDLGIEIARDGDDAGAEREFRAAIEDAPYYPRAYYNYGTFLLHDDRLPAAIAAFERAIALSPAYLKAHLGLVAANVAAGDGARAAAACDTLRALAPRSREAAQAAELLGPTEAEALGH